MTREPMDDIPDVNAVGETPGQCEDMPLPIELTEIGEQYCIPGTERNRTAKPKTQLTLWS